MEGTEIYAPLWARSVLIEGNTIFLLDREGRLLCFDGKRLKELARKGEGPGELTRPQGFFRDEKSILVLDRQRFHIFSLAGTFHETRRLPPGLGSMVEKVAGGWVGINGLGYGQANNPLSLIFFKDDFSEKVRYQQLVKREGTQPHTARNPASRPFQPRRGPPP